MTIMDYIDVYRVIINSVTAVTIAVLVVSVVRIRKEIMRRKASGIGGGLSFLCGYGHAGWMRWVYITGGILTLVMICVHGYKKLFLGAYIPKDTIQFYVTVFLLFLLLIVQNSILSVFRLCKKGFYYRGKKHNRKKCYYLFEKTELLMFTMDSGEPDSIVLEYYKEAEVKIPKNKREETVKMLEKYYTEFPEGAPYTETKNAKRFYKTDIIWGILVCALAVLFINRGYIINEWETNDVEDGMEITGYNGNKTWIDIPMYVDGQVVVSIKDFGNSFLGKKTEVKHVFFPESIDRISGDSFVGYESLEEIFLPSSVHILGESAFRECPLLELVLIYGTEKGGDVVNLSGTNIMLKELHLMDCDIKDGMFSEFPYLESVVISGNVEIAPGAFRNCATLKYVSLPEGLETISDSVFTGCKSLYSIHVPESLKKIGKASFSGCEALEHIDLPYGIESIGDHAFEGCESLQHIFLPEGIKWIGNSAFSGSGIIRVAVTGRVGRLSDRAFANCNSLQDVILYTGIKTIGESAFEGCESLQNIQMPDSIKVIEDSAFSGCETLKNIDLPEGAEEIGAWTFEGCESLQSIELSDSMVYLGEGAFANCTALETLRLPSSLQAVPKDCFCGCSSLSEIEIPEGYTEIAPYAFYLCTGVESVTLPDSLKTIEEQAFSQLQVKSVFLPDGLTVFRDMAFISEQLEEPVYLCHTENSKIVEQIEAACQKWQIYDAYKSLTVKDREEYEGLWRYPDFLSEAAEPGEAKDVIYYVEDTEWEDVQLDRLLNVSEWISYDAGTEYYTYVAADHPMTLHFEKDGTGVLTEKSEESFTWKLGEVSCKNILVTMDDSGKEYALTFYSYDGDHLYLGLHMWDRKVFFFSK